MNSVCVAQLLVTVNCVRKLSVAQQCSMVNLSEATMKMIRTSFWRKLYSN